MVCNLYFHQYLHWVYWFRIGGKGTDNGTAISEGHGDTAMVLLKAGAETDKRDVDGNLAIDLAPDKKVGLTTTG